MSKGVPGPGTYKVTSSLSKKGARLIGRNIAKDLFNAPGPGTYKVRSLFRKGTSYNTKHKYMGSIKFTT